MIYFALSSTTKSILKFSVGMLSCAKILLHEEKTAKSGDWVMETGPTIHHPSNVRTAYGSSLLLVMTSLGQLDNYSQ